MSKERYIRVENKEDVFILDTYHEQYVEASLRCTEDCMHFSLSKKDGVLNDKDEVFLRDMLNSLNGKHEVVKGKFNWDQHEKEVSKAIESQENLKKEVNKEKTNYYGGENNTYEAIKVILAHDLGFCLGNVIKYVLRAGKKNKETEIQDLEKAKNYIDYRIEELKK